MASMAQANQTNRAATAIKAEAIAAHQMSAEPFPYPPLRAVESKSIYPPSRAREGRERAERIPLGIICVLAATILLAGSSALSKWLVGTYPGVDTFQAGSLFALANAILFGTVTVGVRSMTATESTETLIMYQMVFLTAFFT